jgi:hypothetical protein
VDKGNIELLQRKGKLVHVKRFRETQQSPRWYQVRICSSLHKEYITFEGKKLYLDSIEDVSKWRIKTD